MATDRRNIWTCETCERSIHARDIDEGVTPFMLQCFATPDCDGEMYSRMYRVNDSWATIPITHEWWLPNENELEILLEGVRKELPAQGAPEKAVLAVIAGVREHVERGGLAMRETPGWKRQLDEAEAAGLPVQMRSPMDNEAREKLVRK